MNKKDILNYVYDALLKELEITYKWDIDYNINIPMPTVNINNIIAYYNSYVYYIDIYGKLSHLNIYFNKSIDIHNIHNSNILSFVEEKEAFYYVGGDQNKKVKVMILYDEIVANGDYREILYSSTSTFASKVVPINDFDNYFKYNYTINNLNLIDEL